MSDTALRSVLWDVDGSKIADLPESFVLQRVLNYGGIKLLLAVMAEYGNEACARVFKEMKQSSMDPRRYRYLRDFVFAE